MENLQVADHGIDFNTLRAAMRGFVEQDILPGISFAILRGRDLLDVYCTGMAVREENRALTTDTIFRTFSNTKLLTSCAALLLMQEGRFQLDDPVERYLPQLADRRVLKPDATSIDDTEPARGPITIRHLMSHSAGLSYGLLDPGTLIHKAYTERGILSPGTTLAQMVDALADLPLTYHPGTSWEYSIATDVLARLVEIVSGQPFDAFLRVRIFEPLGMTDTGFFVPEGKRDRFAALYVGADPADPMKPGLTRLDYPAPDAFLHPVPRLSGGGGLVSTLPDMVTLLRALMPGENTLLEPETLALMMANQLPDGVYLRFPNIGELPGKAHGVAGAVTVAPLPFDVPEWVGEVQWGGIAGTHWWISPGRDLAAVVMTQRHMSFWNPFYFEFKQLLYQAIRGGQQE